jgi:LysM repeat protein
MKCLDPLRPTAIAICLIVATSVLAAERTHTVQRGESASSIAKHYYGSYEVSDLLLRFNGKSSSVIRPGEKLRVPVCEIHRIRSGDSWSGIAKRYLGKPNAYRAIATLNGIAPEKPLRIGDEIVIPVILDHPLKRGETLAALSKRFYGDANSSRLLQTFNQIDDPRDLSVGQTIRIPLVSFRSRGSAAETRTPSVAKAERADPTAAAAPRKSEKREAKPEPQPAKPTAKVEPKPAAKVEAKPAPAGPSRLAGEIRTASEAFANGDYDRARGLLESLRDRAAGEGTETERADFWRLLAFVYVAFDLPDEACAAHRSLVRTSAETKLDPDLVSPKIRQTLAQCSKRDG